MTTVTGLDDHRRAASVAHRADRPRSAPLTPLLEWVESASRLDAWGKASAKRVRALLSGDNPAGQAIKDGLSGTWLGHALHPALTDVVVGSLLSATLVDVFGARRPDGADRGKARDGLIRVGLLAAVPTALTGANDWADAEPGNDSVRRAGVIHAGTNSAALLCYTSSLIARRKGARRAGLALNLAGAALLVASAYLGGHLSFTRGVGPNQTVFDPGPDDWTAVSLDKPLSEGQPTRVVVDETPVLLLRDGDRVLAVHDRCSHRGCSLSHTGTVDGQRITCGCHGSTFDLRDGSIHRGPATAPQPAYEVREHEGRLELRRVVS